VNLETILCEDELEVIESRVEDPGYTACLVRNPYGTGGGILLAPRQETGRRRFSLAHELGHFHIPNHRSTGVALTCADDDLRAQDADAKRIEWEANEFAAELLMPYRLFAADTEYMPISINSARWLASAEMYDVSVTAAAWRLVQVTSEPCALVLSTDGILTWTAKSSNWRGWLRSYGTPLDPNSLAASVFRGEEGSSDAVPVEAGVWFYDTVPTATSLFESTHAIPSQNQVLSLLWLVPEGDGNSDGD
jgi:hypothetical protein